MTTYTAPAKNSTTYSTSPRLSGNAILEGMPIGLLLALTYAASVFTQYTGGTKNSTSYSTITKN